MIKQLIIFLYIVGQSALFFAKLDLDDSLNLTWGEIFIPTWLFIIFGFIYWLRFIIKNSK